MPAEASVVVEKQTAEVAVMVCSSDGCVDFCWAKQLCLCCLSVSLISLLLFLVAMP